MKKRCLWLLLLTSFCTFICAENDAIYYSDQNLHIKFTIDKEKKEAIVGTGTKEDDSALALPAWDNAWWDNQVNLWEDVVIPSVIEYGGETYTVTSVASYAFYRTTRLKRITLPETIRSIGSAAFYWCVNLESINIPSQVTAINSETFVLCRKLKSIQLPNSVQSIGGSAFSDCIGLEEINIPSNCHAIGNDAFKWCKSLRKLTIDNGEGNLTLGFTEGIGLDYQSILEGHEDSESHPRGLFADCPLEILYVGKNIVCPEEQYSFIEKRMNTCLPFESISEYMTRGVEKYIHGQQIVDLQIGNTVTTIPDNLFSTVIALNDVTLPKTIEFIGENAFKGTLHQDDIAIPASASYIDKTAFSNCSFRFVHCQSEVPPSEESPFDATIYVPEGAGNVYRTKWGNVIIDPSDFYITVNVKTAGSLYSRLLAQDIQSTDIFRLQVKGILNDDDWGMIKNMKYLYDLDISELTLDELPNDYFKGFTALASIQLPKTLKVIRDEEFADCKTLSNNMEIPACCSSIGINAFNNTAINRLVFNGVTNIGASAFAKCPYLSDVEFLHEAIIGSNAFEATNIERITIPADVIVGDNAFKDTPLKEVVIKDGVTKIGDNALGSSFEKITFEGNVGEIGHLASEFLSEIHVKDLFTWCNLAISNSSFMDSAPQLYINGQEVKNVVIPEGIHNIRKYAFMKCQSLESVQIPTGVKSIEDRAFEGCEALYDIELPSTLTAIGNNVFLNCKSLMNIVLPSKLISIGESAFENCSNLKGIQIPQNVKFMGNAALANCTNLISINLPSDLECINQLLYGCSSLEEIEIPAAVSSIGSASFEGCNALSKVIVHWDSPVVLKGDEFPDLSSNCFLYIPIGKAAKYSQAGWNIFPNLKEAGILTVNANEGGVVKCYDTEVINRIGHIPFTPYKSFYINILPNDGFKILKAQLNGVNILSAILENKLFIEEPEEDFTLSLIFADSSIKQGDVNGDGVINMIDVKSTIEQIQKNTPKDFFEYWADMNNDEVINITDVLMILDAYLKNN